MPHEILMPDYELTQVADKIEPWAIEDTEIEESEHKDDPVLQRIMSNKIRTDDPKFDQLTSARRSAVYAHINGETVEGGEPDHVFIEPIDEREYVPAPVSPTPRFATERKQSRRRI